MIAVGFSHLVAAYGYPAVFGAVALESVGVPVPGETTLVAAATYAGATHKLSLVLLILVAMLAAVVGDNLGYLVGRLRGERFLLRMGHHLHIDGAKLESKLVVTRYLFSRHGAKIVFLGRFVTILRTYAALLAGTGEMAWKRFLFSNALGGVTWAFVFGVGAYEFGGLVTRIGNVMAIILGTAAVILAVLGYLAMRRYVGEILVRARTGTLQSHSGPHAA